MTNRNQAARPMGPGRSRRVSPGLRGATVVVAAAAVASGAAAPGGLFAELVEDPRRGVSGIELRFSDAVDPASADPPARLAPQVPGRWRWKDERTLVFEPQGLVLPAATAYRIEIAEGLRSRSKAALAGRRTFERVSPPPGLVRSWPSWRGGPPVGPNQVFALEFGGRVDAAAVLAVSSLELAAPGGEPTREYSERGGGAPREGPPERARRVWKSSGTRWISSGTTSESPADRPGRADGERRLPGLPGSEERDRGLAREGFFDSGVLAAGNHPCKAATA